jgi:hypothetical protein
VTRILLATNEPWGTYHLAPLVQAAARAAVDLVHVVPDLDRAALPATVTPGGSLSICDLATACSAALDGGVDLLVVTGATDWPGEVARALPTLPVVASCLAYMPATTGEASSDLSPRIRAVTAAGRGDADSFVVHLDLPHAPQSVICVGVPLLDPLGARRRQQDSVRAAHPPAGGAPTALQGREVLVLTSVTRADATGAAAPGTELLQQAANLLHDRGATVRVRRHPREDPTWWDRFTPCPHADLLASLDDADLVLMIPGTAAPIAAAAGVPVAAITAPGLAVPAHITDVCGTHLSSLSEVRRWVGDGAVTAATSPTALTHAIGPLGGAAERLIAVWETAIHTP